MKLLAFLFEYDKIKERKMPMNKSVTKKNDQSLLYFLILALLSLSFGSVFAIQFKQFNFLALTLFYLYILTNQLIENILLRIPDNDFQRSKNILRVLEILNAVLILYFTWSYSFMAGAVLLLYTLLIQGQFLFHYYDLEKLAILISTFLKVFLLNGFAFYIHTNFIPYASFLYPFGILLPYLGYEITRTPEIRSNRFIKLVTFLSYPLAIIILWKELSYFSLFLLLSIPFSLLNAQKINRKSTAQSLIIFSTFYIALLILSFTL